MTTALENTITKGSKILNPRNSIGVVTNEDRCIVGVVLSVSGNLVTFRKIWDTEETKVFSARIYIPGIVTPESDPPIEEGEILPFFRVGDFNSDGDESFEKHTENASNFSWIGFVVSSIAVSPYYILNNDVVTSSSFLTYWLATFFDGQDGDNIYHFNKVNMWRNSDIGEPNYCVPSRHGYSTWKAKYYTDYDEDTKTYSGLVFTQDCYYVSSLWSDDLILPRVGTGVPNKKDLVPFGYHPFDLASSMKDLYLKIEEKSTSDYSSTATSNNATYLYDNSVDLTTLLIPGENVTINTSPVQVREIDTVYSDHLSFTEALTTSITIGITFTVDFKNRGTWIYDCTKPTRFFYPVSLHFWTLSMSGSATSGGYYYRYADAGYFGICEESTEVLAITAYTQSGPPWVIHGGPIPDSDWIADTTHGNLATAYTKNIVYDYTYRDEYLGGGVKISMAASDWYVWDETVTPYAWRQGIVGETISYIYVYEIWEKQRYDSHVFSLTLT